MTNPVAGKITGRYGVRKHPVTGTIQFHNGVDIACPVGTPIMAPLDGEITELWNHSTGGKSLAMKSGNTRFGFAHLSSYSSAIGQKVKEGEIIAYSGNSGRVTGPHLHFTVTDNGRLKDPLNMFFQSPSTEY